MDWANHMSFLTRLEQLQFVLSKSSSESPSSEADAYRHLYLHLTDARSKSKSSSSDFSALTMEAGRNAEMYANIVDNMDESGLNNFAAGALSLCHYHKNESSKWQTSLGVDNILSLPCFQDTDQMVITNKSDRANFVIPLKTRKKAVDNTSGLFNTSLVALPSKQPQNDDIPIQKKAQYTSAFGNTNVQGRKNQPEMNPFKPYEKKNSQIPALSSNSNKFESKESVSVVASKVGGPYANFGQKRKVKNNWTSGTEGSKSWAKKCEDDEDDTEKQIPFRTAREQLVINQQKKFGNTNERNQVTGSNYGSVKRSLGTRRGPANKFVPPVLGQDPDEYRGDGSIPRSTFQRDQTPGGVKSGMEEPVDERLIGIDPNMIELIKNEIMDHGTQISWSDIAGLEFAKKTIKEIVVWPMLRPDIFTGLRGPPKGLLLFGPPGTGKTLIGKCIASQSKSTFFCISASTLTSKWVGEGEKMVRALFAVARCSQPAVVFIDEVDSLLSQRSDSEHESSRRIKTEFLVQLDGASTASDERLLVIGATNRPQEIDEAARRRFVKRLLIPLPESVARMHIVVNLMSQQRYNLNDSDLQHICDKTEGYSGADMSNLCREAALGPIRSIPFEEMETITPDQVRPIHLEDFEEALLQVRASVSPKDLELYVDWNKTYGSFGHG